ncbi:PHP domain-containing protein [Hafnia alvei]|nr:PHP domain-containing protein [Hafnia alvei]QQE42171.1 PHP domain-containing protein [Hafnia alvei]
MEKIDLHMHSDYSDDADYPVAELIARCLREGVTTLAVTDHNSAFSFAESLKWRSDSLNIISGIEIDCTFQGRNFHLLGYGFTPSDDFSQVYENFNNIQRELVPVKLTKLRELGFFIDDENLARLANGRLPQEEQMGEAILEDERNADNPLLLPYRSGGERADMPLINFYWDFFGPNKVCYQPVTYPALEDMADLIRNNGGIPVIAHIGANLKEEHEAMLELMLESGVAGIEVFSSYHDEALAQRLYNFACEQGAYVTCGSDFHGRNKPKIEVGTCQYNREQLAEIQRFIDVVSKGSHQA